MDVIGDLILACHWDSCDQVLLIVLFSADGDVSLQ